MALVVDKLDHDDTHGHIDTKLLSTLPLSKPGSYSALDYSVTYAHSLATVHLSAVLTY